MGFGASVLHFPLEAGGALPPTDRSDLVIEGAGLQAGYTIAPACIISTVAEKVQLSSISPETCGAEIDRLAKAAAAVAERLQGMVSHHSNAASAQSGLTDSLSYLQPSSPVYQEVVEHITRDHWSAEYAVQEAFDRHAASIDSPFTRDRAYEAIDIKNQLIRALNPRAQDTVEQFQKQLAALPGPKIVVTENLSPAEALQLLNQQVRGVVIFNAGHVGHQAIVLKDIGCPVVGNVSLSGLIGHGEEIVVDGDKGFVTLRPSGDLRDKALALMRVLDDPLTEKIVLPDGMATTKDGVKIRICADLTNPDRVGELSAQVGEIGLVRTEFLFLKANEWPSEEKQLEIFRAILQGAAPHGVSLRTFDFGSDKVSEGLACHDAVDSGIRGIRYALAIRHKEFNTQLRAMVRAAAETQQEVRIIFPMVLDVGDMRKAKAELNRAVGDLIGEGVIAERPQNIRVGPMVETSSAVELIDPILRESDFISIGTNDLLKSTLDGDLNKAAGAHYHPANLSCVRRSIQAAERAGKPVYICGEMPCHTKNVPLLIGVGARSFVVSAQELGAVINKVGRCEIPSCEGLVDKIIESGDGDEAYAIHVNYLAQLNGA
ncbi:MAG: phosphoenolpyruvate--protein phosphotransferase [Deltaproteobacteria bacterium]|nr:phosphoenolpyruvate--protein phosphotransferase [Deltaproteobacteria bacterium]